MARATLPTVYTVSFNGRDRPAAAAKIDAFEVHAPLLEDRRKFPRGVNSPTRLALGKQEPSNLAALDCEDYASQQGSLHRGCVVRRTCLRGVPDLCPGTDANSSLSRN